MARKTDKAKPKGRPRRGTERKPVPQKTTPPPDLPEGPNPSGNEERFVLTSAVELAKFFGVHRVTIQEWLNKGLPGTRGTNNGTSGRFYLPEVIAWLRENVWQPKREISDSELEKEKLRVEVATRTLKLEQLAGKLVDRTVTLAMLTSICNVIRGRLDQIPLELSNSLPVSQRAEFKRDAQNKINLIKQELVNIGLRGGP